MTDRLYLNAEDTATRLRIATPTLYRWVKTKKFPKGEVVERTGMPGPRTVTLWDIRVVDQWAIDNNVVIRIDPTLPDHKYMGLADDKPYVGRMRLVAYAIGAAAIAYLIYSLAV